MISILGAGPHGHQLAAIVRRYDHVELYDDNLDDYESVLAGANTGPWLVGAAWPKVRQAIAESVADAKYNAAYGTGTVFYPGAHFGNDVTWGKHLHVQ